MELAPIADPHFGRRSQWSLHTERCRYTPTGLVRGGRSEPIRTQENLRSQANARHEMEALLRAELERLQSEIRWLRREGAAAKREAERAAAAAETAKLGEVWGSESGAAGPGPIIEVDLGGRAHAKRKSEGRSEVSKCALKSRIFGEHRHNRRQCLWGGRL